MDQTSASTEKPPIEATKAQTEADVDPREVEVVEAQRDDIRAGAAGESSDVPEASLRDYFLKDYKGGGVFEHDAYEEDPTEWCWIHKSSGIKVWQDALDLAQSSGSGEVECFFHYTTQLGFRNITAPQKKAVEVFASLVTSGPNANAWWGRGVYTVRRAPDDWPDVATLIDNNYRNMHARDVKTKGREAADEEYASRVAYCIPILANAVITYDVSIQQTPEMQKEGKLPGVNLAGKLLNEPGQPERQCVVIRVEREEEVGHASAVLLETLRCRADATAERLGPEDLFALQALSRLAYVLEERGAPAEAEPLRRRLLEARERLRAPEHRGTLIAANNLAFVLKRLGKFSEAEALHRRALAAREAHLGANHPETLTSMSNLANLLLQQGKLAEAEGLHRRALEGRESQLGPQHPGTLESANNLAVVLEKQGKLEEAEGLHRRALEGSESQLGPQHPLTLTFVNNLAFLLQKQGKLEEAEELFRRALTGREGQLGPEHPDTLSSVRNLAILLEVKGSVAEAGQLYLQHLRGMEELHGRDAEEVRASRNDLEQFQQEHGPVV